MSKHVKVKGNRNLVRDRKSGAILNINSNEMSQARSRKSIWRQQQEELITLKSDVAYMKDMMEKLLEERK